MADYKGGKWLCQGKISTFSAFIVLKLPIKLDAYAQRKIAGRKWRTKHYF
jgi:hypothetical protein